MATNLALDDKLINDIVRMGKFKTKKDAVTAAMRHYRAKLAGADIVKLFGKVEFRDDWDPMKARGKPPGGLNANRPLKGGKTKDRRRSA